MVTFLSIPFLPLLKSVQLSCNSLIPSDLSMDFSLTAEMLYCFFIMKLKASTFPDTLGKGRQRIKSEIRSLKLESHTQSYSKSSQLHYIFLSLSEGGGNEQMLNGGKRNLSASQVHTNCFCLSIFVPWSILICYFSFGGFFPKLPEYRKKKKGVENGTKWNTKHFPPLSVVWVLLGLGASKSLHHLEAHQHLYETANGSQLGEN